MLAHQAVILDYTSIINQIVFNHNLNHIKQFVILIIDQTNSPISLISIFKQDQK